MIFEISRASDSNGIPCEEALKRVWVTKEITYAKWNEEKKCQELVREKKDVFAWTIEINSLEDLMKLSEKYGELIINQEEKSIVIYDDYIE